MHRVMCKFTDNQTSMCWERWLEVMHAEKQAGAVMLRCLTHIENHYQAQGFGTWVDTTAAARERTAEENEAAKIAALDEAHAAKVAALEQAQEEGKRNETILKEFYLQHSPDAKMDYMEVLESYSLTQIVGLAMMRYGEAPELYSKGKLVPGKITEEMSDALRESLLKEKEAAEAVAKAKAQEVERGATLERERMERHALALKAKEDAHIAAALEQRGKDATAKERLVTANTRLSSLVKAKEVEYASALEQHTEAHAQAAAEATEAQEAAKALEEAIKAKEAEFETAIRAEEVRHSAALEVQRMKAEATLHVQEVTKEAEFTAMIKAKDIAYASLEEQLAKAMAELTDDEDDEDLEDKILVDC
jgi:hypothetical protein